MADNLYQVGDVVPLQATFENAAGVPTDTTVTLEVRAPDGTVTTPTPTHAGTGVYTYNLTVTEAGLYWYAFIGTGAVAATQQDSFVSEERQTTTPTLSAGALTSLQNAREYVLGEITDDSQDTKLIRIINRVSAAAAVYTKREWLPVVTAATRIFRYPGYGMLHFAPFDLRVLTSATVFTDYPTSYQHLLAPPTTTDLGDYVLRPQGADPYTGTYRWLEFNYSPFTATPFVPPYWWWNWSNLDQDRWRTGFQVTVTGDWGIGTIPSDVEEAILIAVLNAYENREGAQARTFGPLGVTEPTELLGPGARWRALPAESRALLADYVDDEVLVG